MLISIYAKIEREVLIRHRPCSSTSKHAPCRHANGRHKSYLHSNSNYVAAEVISIFFASSEGSREDESDELKERLVKVFRIYLESAIGFDNFRKLFMAFR